MRIVIILVSLALVLPPLALLKYIAPLALISQAKCLALIRSDIANHELQQAFFCGLSMNDGPNRRLWITTGLYHLLVVSGSHLIFLSVTSEMIFNRLNSRGPKKHVQVQCQKLILVLILVLFTLLTGFQPPLVRALTMKALQSVSDALKLGWAQDLVINLSGLFCLLLFPQWLSSKSLILSWSASLALTLGKGVTQKSVFVFFITAPCLWGWGQLNPLVILANIFVGPLASLLLIISGLLLWPAKELSEGILKLLVFVLEAVSEVIPLTVSSTPSPLVFSWISLIGIAALIHIKQRQRKRAQCTN